MEKPSNKLWRILMGFEPSREQKEIIFDECERDKLSLQEVCGRYQMSSMYIMKTNDPDEKVELEGELMTLAQIKALYPYKRIVIIRTRI